MDFEDKYIKRTIRYDRNDDIRMRFQAQIRNDSLESVYILAISNWLNLQENDENLREKYEKNVQISSKIIEFYAISDENHVKIDEKSSISIKIRHFLIDFDAFLRGISKKSTRSNDILAVNKGFEVINFIILYVPEMLQENKELFNLICKNKAYKHFKSELSKKCHVAGNGNSIYLDTKEKNKSDTLEGPVE